MATSKAQNRPPRRLGREAHAVRKEWQLQEAKARFSEMLVACECEGPQLVTVRGREEVVVVAADEFRRLKGERTGTALVEALQASPHKDIEIAPKRARAPVRGVEL